MRAALADLMTSVGLSVEVFESAREFLEYKRPDTPACLVLDVRLPDLSGLDLQRELYRTGAPIPIVFVTGHGDIPMSVRAMKEGAVEFLTKPFRAESMSLPLGQYIVTGSWGIDKVFDRVEKAALEASRERAHGAEEPPYKIVVLAIDPKEGIRVHTGR